MRHLKGGVLRVEILDACLKELRSFPKEVLRDFLDATAKLDAGLIRDHFLLLGLAYMNSDLRGKQASSG